MNAINGLVAWKSLKSSHAQLFEREAWLQSGSGLVENRMVYTYRSRDHREVRTFLLPPEDKDLLSMKADTTCDKNKKLSDRGTA